MKTDKPHNASRRRFIVTGAAAPGFPSIVPAAVPGRKGRPAPSGRVTVGLIGCGTIALGWTKNFIDCIYNGKPTAAPIKTAHRTITIAHLGNIGVRLGRKSLKWNPHTEQVVDDVGAQNMLKREWRKPWAV